MKFWTFVGISCFCAAGIGIVAFVIWCANTNRISAEEQTKQPNSYHYHKQVRLAEKEIVRPVKHIALGEGPLWVQHNAFVVDKQGYLWIRFNAWAYPGKFEEAPIEIMPEVRGFSVKISRRRDFPMPVAQDLPLRTYKDFGYIPVVKITYEDEKPEKDKK